MVVSNKVRRDRVKKRKEALEVFARHSGAVLNVLSEVIFDLRDEVEMLKKTEQDQAFCAELLYRLSNGSRYGDPGLVELNGCVLVFVAMAATNVWTMAARRDKTMRRARLPRICAQLRKDGERIARGMSYRANKQARALRFRL